MHQNWFYEHFLQAVHLFHQLYDVTLKVTHIIQK